MDAPGPWSSAEDDRLRELVSVHSTKKWSIVAQNMRNRNGKQCRERWLNHLNPGIRKGAWSAEEEEILIEAHKRIGNAWSEIARLLVRRALPSCYCHTVYTCYAMCYCGGVLYIRHLALRLTPQPPTQPGRSDNSIKNHWNSAVRRMGHASSLRRAQVDPSDPQFDRKRRASEALEKYAKIEAKARAELAKGGGRSGGGAQQPHKRGNNARSPAQARKGRGPASPEQPQLLLHGEHQGGISGWGVNTSHPPEMEVPISPRDEADRSDARSARSPGSEHSSGSASGAGSAGAGSTDTAESSDAQFAAPRANKRKVSLTIQVGGDDDLDAASVLSSLASGDDVASFWQRSPQQLAGPAAGHFSPITPGIVDDGDAQKPSPTMSSASGRSGGCISGEIGGSSYGGSPGPFTRGPSPGTLGVPLDPRQRPGGGGGGASGAPLSVGSGGSPSSPTSEPPEPPPAELAPVSCIGGHDVGLMIPQQDNVLHIGIEVAKPAGRPSL